MLKMTEITDLRKMYFEDGENISQIRKKTGFARKTIRKIINKQDWNDPVQPHISKDSKLDKFKSQIDQWLVADKKMRKKQRHTAKRVYDRLTEQYKKKFDCSYRTVAKYVAREKQSLYANKQNFLPLEHQPGEAQIDFGKAEFIENKKSYYGSYLNVSFPYSNAGFLQLFKGENFECLAEGLGNIFKHINGVPHRQWYDNMSTAVNKILKGGKRDLTSSFIKLKEHYCFNAVFCNRNAGNEKGNVENKVGYLRRNFLVPKPEFKNLAEYNKQLLQRCERDLNRIHYRKERLISELFKEDLLHCNLLPHMSFKSQTYEAVLVDSYGKFTLEKGKHSYSSMPRFAGARITICKTASEVLILDKEMNVVVTHKRLYGKQQQESMDWMPYLKQLSRKPAALKYTGIYELLPNQVTDWLDKQDNADRGKALKLLYDLTSESSFSVAVDALQTALDYNSSDPESIIAVHARLINHTPVLPPIALPSSVPAIPAAKPDIMQYDKLFFNTGGDHVCN
jgi:transposase